MLLELGCQRQNGLRMKKAISDYIVLIVSIIGSFASIIAFGAYFSPLLDNQGIVGVLFLGFIALFFMGYNFYLISKYRKKTQYAEILQDINIIFSNLHNLDSDGIYNQIDKIYQINKK